MPILVKISRDYQANCLVSRSFMKRDNSGQYITVTSNPVEIIIRTNEHKPVSKN